jgi:glucokinase
MSKPFAIGVDVGGTKIHAGLVSIRGTVLASRRLPSGVSGGKKEVLRGIETSIAAVWKTGVKAIGLGMAGLTDPKKGIYVEGPNLPESFRNVEICRLLRKKFGVPTFIDNDVHCFTLAEALFGSAKGHRAVVGITLGTGIGGGIVMDGAIYRGRDNAAGEIGHMTLDIESGAVCGCGRRGHFEALASGSAMSNLYAAATGRTVDAPEVEAAAMRGEEEAVRVLDRMATALAAGIANAIHALNPDMITVGGGLANANALWKPALSRIEEFVVYPALRKTPVVRAKLGDDANIIGAAWLAKTAKK